jgi:hypothetical protein
MLVPLLPFLAVLGVLALAPALPPALRERSVKRFLGAWLLSILGVILPLLVFFASAMLLPEWQGDCRHGWLDAFHLGKLALTPLVLWATGALYASDILRVPQPAPPWVGPGLVIGALASLVCLLFGVATLDPGAELAPLLIVPAYVCAWHSARALEWLGRATERRSLGKALLGSSPFWIGSVLWSRSIYASLPREPPQCFVVTAAGRGHPALVGPFVEVTHRGGKRLANRQLATLWRFEALWQARAPASHARFRRVYDRVGPVLARRIDTSLRADAVYLALRPVEFVAGLLLKHAARSGGVRSLADSARSRR